MNRVAVILLASALVCGACNRSETGSAPLPAVTPAAAPAVQAYTGEIMDGTCGAMGSHETMEQGKSAKDAKDCALKCVAAGSSFVLYDPTTRMAYKLDDQAASRKFAGQKVKVVGTADIAAKTIHVQRIEGA